MALLSLQSSSFTNKPHLLLFKTLPTKPKFTIFCLDSSSSESQSSKPIINNDPIEQSSDKKPISSTGQGFGSTQLPKPSSSTGKKKGKRERASIIRRNPVEKPAFLGKKNGVEEDNQQGLLPEEWDKFLVKFLYPSFTPTVFLFVAGTVVYGVQKYLQNENAREEK
uniref:Transmembrane protein n=1 Tax=Chenopodium quinoa TaxID=63459 RepID=A0A803MTW1_CHEQI